jgi:hypothetical protein
MRRVALTQRFGAEVVFAATRQIISKRFRDLGDVRSNVHSGDESCISRGGQWSPRPEPLEAPFENGFADVVRRKKKQEKGGAPLQNTKAQRVGHPGAFLNFKWATRHFRFTSKSKPAPLNPKGAAPGKRCTVLCNALYFEETLVLEKGLSAAVPGTDGLAEIINDAVDDANIVLPAYDY